MPDPIVNPNATANAPAIQTQDSDLSGQQQLQPSSAPASAPVSVTVPGAPGPAATSKNSQLHRLVTQVLGALAGEPPKQYAVDSATGKMTALPAAPETTTDKLKRISRNALIGLGAGSQVGPQKSGLASALAGFGAGANAVGAQMSAQDQVAKNQAETDFERGEQMKLRKYEIARQNGLELSTYIANRKAMNDMSPIFQEGNTFLRTVQASPDLAPHIQEMTDAQVTPLLADPNFRSTHIVKPLGWQTETDPSTGEAIRDSQGNLTSHMTFAVMDGTKDGKIVVSPEWASDFAKYGKMTGIGYTDTIKAGDEYEWGQLIPLHNKVDEQKKIVTEGELNREYAWQSNAAGKNVPVSINTRLPQGDPDRIKQLDYVPAKLLAEQAKNDLEESQAANQRANAKATAAFGPSSDPLAVANYKGPDNLMGQSPTDLRKYLTDNKQPVPANFETLYAVGHYDQDPKVFTKSLRKGAPQMTEDMAINYIRRYINPTYQDTNYDAVKKMKVEFADLKSGPGASLLAFNTATGHLGQLWLAAEALQNKDTQALNKIGNAYGVAVGKSPVTTFNAIRAAIVGEIGKTFKGGPADIPERQDIEAGLNANMGPKQLAGVIQADAHLMLTKAKQTGLAYYNYVGEYPPNTVSEDARKVYKDLGIDSSDVISGAQIRGSQPSSQSGQPQNAPAGASQEVYAADGKTLIGHVVNNKFVALGQ